MPGLNGLDLQLALGRSANPMPLFPHGQGDIPMSVRCDARRGGGFFEPRPRRKAALLHAIQRALARECVRTRGGAPRRNELCKRFEKLTEREHEVLGHVVRGAEQTDRRRPLGIHGTHGEAAFATSIHDEVACALRGGN